MATDTDNARKQAQAQFDTIKEMVEQLQAAQESNNNTDCEKAEQTIHDDPLEVDVRSDWHTPGDPDFSKPSEYKILLCTGGPAVRIIGDLSRYSVPENANLEYQDWFTPWEEYPLNSDDEQILLTYAQQFYFGE